MESVEIRLPSAASRPLPPQVSSLPAHAGAAAVRTLQEGAGQRSVRQVHRRAAAAALAALLQETHPAAAGAGRAAAAAAAAATTRERRRQVMMSSEAGGGLYVGTCVSRMCTEWDILQCQRSADTHTDTDEVKSADEMRGNNDRTAADGERT